MMIGKYVNDYVDYQKSEGISYERTISKYSHCINEFILVMDIKTIEDIKNLTYIDIRKNWINKKKETLSSQSLNLRITAIRSFFNYLMGMRLIDENVADKIKKFPIKNNKSEIDKEEIKKLLLASTSEYNANPNYLTMRDRFLLHLLIETGLRNEEARNLKINDINWSTGEFKVIGKGSKERCLAISDGLMKMYHEYLSYRNTINTNENYLFVSKTGRHMDKNAMKYIINKLCDIAQINCYVVPHYLRHCAATLMINSNISIEEVSQILGHSNSTITSRAYCHSVKHRAKEIVNKNNFIKEII